MQHGISNTNNLVLMICRYNKAGCKSDALIVYKNETPTLCTRLQHSSSLTHVRMKNIVFSAMVLAAVGVVQADNCTPRLNYCGHSLIAKGKHYYVPHMKEQNSSQLIQKFLRKLQRAARPALRGRPRPRSEQRCMDERSLHLCWRSLGCRNQNRDLPQWGLQRQREWQKRHLRFIRR